MIEKEDKGMVTGVEGTVLIKLLLQQCDKYNAIFGYELFWLCFFYSMAARAQLLPGPYLKGTQQQGVSRKKWRLLLVVFRETMMSTF